MYVNLLIFCKFHPCIATPLYAEYCIHYYYSYLLLLFIKKLFIKNILFSIIY